MDELKPILVTSPTIRSGTTLLQRLLCSSSNALIYGEEIAKDLEMQLQLFASRKLVYSHSRQRFASSFDKVMQGDTRDWIPDLMPDIDAYLEALCKGSFAGLAYCREHALKAGRELWGFKYPAWPPHLIRMLVNTIPGTRVIYIHRHLLDCVRSAKAWGEINNETQLQHFCGQWAGHMKFIRQWRPSTPVLILSYEALIKNPELSIQELCDFLPFENLQRDVLRHKINNMTNGISPQGHNNYIEPAALSRMELDHVEAIMASMESVNL